MKISNIIAIIAVFLLSTFRVCGQISFTLEGKINLPAKGKIYLTHSGADKSYYGGNAVLDSAEVRNGKFQLQHVQHDSGVYAYRLVMPEYGQTGMALIGPRDRSIVIESFDDYSSPIIEGSAAEWEMKNQYEKAFKSIIDRAAKLNAYGDSLYDIHAGDIGETAFDAMHRMEEEIVSDADTLLYSYTLHHQSSAVSLWKLIERFNTFGYKNIYWDCFQQVSAGLQRSVSGQALKAALSSASTIGIGKKFPSLALQNVQGKSVKLDIGKDSTKLYLVDFWFQSCPPCLRDIAIYKRLYDRYKAAGLEVIGISVDNREDKQKWKDKISQNNMKWRNYLDENGMLAKKLSISKYPTTFLLDRNGHIIQVDISIYQLKLKLIAMNKNVDLYEKQPIDIQEPS